MSRALAPGVTPEDIVEYDLNSDACDRFAERFIRQYICSVVRDPTDRHRAPLTTMLHRCSGARPTDAVCLGPGQLVCWSAAQNVALAAERYRADAHGVICLSCVFRAVAGSTRGCNTTHALAQIDYRIDKRKALADNAKHDAGIRMGSGGVKSAPKRNSAQSPEAQLALYRWCAKRVRHDLDGQVWNFTCANICHARSTI